MDKLYVIKNLGFRELENKWVFFDDKKSLKKLIKMTKLKNIEGPLIGYFYIDQDSGLTLKILGPVLKDYKDNLYLDEFYLKENIILNYGDILNLKLKFLEEAITDNINGLRQIEISLKTTDDKYKLQEARIMTDIDEFRNEAYPDDVQVVLNINSKKDDEVEILWAKIIGIEPNDVFICVLLTSSINSKEYLKDSLVGVKYDKEAHLLKIVGFLKEKKKEEKR